MTGPGCQRFPEFFDWSARHHREGGWQVVEEDEPEDEAEGDTLEERPGRALQDLRIVLVERYRGHSVASEEGTCEWGGKFRRERFRWNCRGSGQGGCSFNEATPRLCPSSRR